MRNTNEQVREQQSATATCTTPSCKATNLSQKVTPKENPVPGKARAANESQKVTPKENPLPGEASEFLRLFNSKKKNLKISRQFQVQRQRTPAPVQENRETKSSQRTKGRKRKVQIPNSLRQPTKGRKEVTPLELYTDPPWMHSFGFRKKEDTETGSDVSAENPQHSPAIGLIYRLNQSTRNLYFTRAQGTASELFAQWFCRIQGK